VTARLRAGRLWLALALALGCGRLGFDGLGEDGPDAGPAPDTLIAAGGCHTCMLRGAELACWGDNAAGQLGTVSPDDAVNPTPVAGGISWRQVVAGAAHTCGIDTAGALHCWGGNGDGQLGLGSPSDLQREPAPVDTVEAVWRQGSAGGQSTCFLQGDRSLWCWGLPLFAASPLEVDRAPHDDVAVGGDSICAVRSHDGRLQCTCAGPACADPDWQTIGSAVGWSRVAAGEAHRCAIDRAGALWCWGDNRDGQLAAGDTDDRDEPTRVGEESDWQQIAAGAHHTCGVRADGSTWCWGANARGELGQGAAGDASPVPLQISF
jgi:hypothetical protein